MSAKIKTEKDKPVAPKREEAKPVQAEPSKLQSFLSYFELSKKELSKVSWPTKKEVQTTALAVIAMVCVMSIFLGLVDLILSRLVQSILSMSI